MMQEKRTTERRRYLRFQLGTKLNYRIEKQDQKKVASGKFAATTKNMSVEGICFQANEDLAVGAEVDLEIFLPNEPEPLLLRGEVRWSRSIESKEAKSLFEIGVRLFTFNQSDEGSYLRYVCDKMTERLRKHLQL